MSARTKRVTLGAVVVVSLLVAVVWALVPWEWSWIDDPGLVLDVHRLQREHGVLGGFVAHMGQMAAGDTTWGLFRPSYWLYVPATYWLPIGLAHALRLVMLALAVVGPCVALRRSGRPWPAVAAAAAVIVSGLFALMQGLFFVSLQELSGAAFIGLGLLLWPRRGGMLVMWTIAAWFKAPFAWFLLGLAFLLWREGRRRLASLAATLWIGTLVVGWWFGHDGSYTSRYGFGWSSVEVAWRHLPDLLSTSAVLPLVALGAWFVVSGTRPQWSPLSLALAVGAGGYTLQMLPWSVAGHYQGGVTYGWALFLASLISSRPVSGVRGLLALAVPAATASLAVHAAMTLGFESNDRGRGISECLYSLGPVNAVLASEFGPEAAVRIPQNVQLRFGDWDGTVAYEGDVPFTSAGVEVVIVPSSRTMGLPENAVPVCEVTTTRVLRLDPS